jgi:biopolymer transport protein ExbD
MRTFLLLIASISTVCILGCSSAKPLALRHYSKNIIAKKDRTLYLEQEQIDFKNLKHELVKRLVTTTTPITVHIHSTLPHSLAEALITKLKTEGFADVQIVIFGDK